MRNYDLLFYYEINYYSFLLLIIYYDWMNECEIMKLMNVKYLNFYLPS